MGPPKDLICTKSSGRRRARTDIFLILCFSHNGLHVSAVSNEYKPSKTERSAYRGAEPRALHTRLGFEESCFHGEGGSSSSITKISSPGGTVDWTDVGTIAGLVIGGSLGGDGFLLLVPGGVSCVESFNIRLLERVMGSGISCKANQSPCSIIALSIILVERVKGDFCACSRRTEVDNCLIRSELRSSSIRLSRRVSMLTAIYASAFSMRADAA